MPAENPFQGLAAQPPFESITCQSLFRIGEWNLLEYHLLATKAFAYRQKRLGIINALF